MPVFGKSTITGNISSEQSSINGNVASEQSPITGHLTTPLIIKNEDYEKLYNLPSIEGVTLFGDKTFYELFPNFLDSFSKIYYGTTEYWTSQRTLISEKNVLYVYTDYDEVDENKLPAFKLGDGNAYLIDLPFLDAKINAKIDTHIADAICHITQEEREYWNSKVRVIEDGDRIILTY